MSQIINDLGFVTDAQAFTFVEPDHLAANADAASVAIDLPSDASADDLAQNLSQLSAVRIDFPSFADGRGFTIAKRLRELGFTGHIRARGHVIADQYAMARRSGFDDVEISDDLAARQPQDQWLARANWQAHDYQSRLKRRA